MNKKSWIAALVVLAAVAAVVVFGRHRIHFNWQIFVEQIQLATWWRIGLAIALIWIAYAVRAMRWAVFLSPSRKVSGLKVLGPQVIGYTGVALLGRPADLARPYLVARKLRTTLSEQIAVYVVERMFDLGAMALIFSSVLYFSPDKKTLPHPELLRHLALTGLIGTVCIAILAVFVRLRGAIMAEGTRRVFAGFAPKLGEGIADKLLAFRNGLHVLSSAREVLLAVVYSLAMWVMISYAYLETAHAFVESPILSHLSLARCMVVIAAGMVASAAQLPVLGWFTQMAALAAILQGFFGVAWEPALGCGAMLLIVTFLSVIPLGLLWARFEHVSLRKIAAESEHAGEALEHAHTPAASE